MQKHEQELRQERKTQRQRNKNFTTFESIFFLLYLYFSEQTEVPYTRYFAIVLFLLITRSYNQLNTEADELLLQYSTEKALRTAAKTNNAELLTKSLKILTLANIDAWGPESGKSALHYAVSGLADETTSLLLNFGANVNLQDSNGDTPVHIALQNIIENKLNSYAVLFRLIYSGTPNTPKFFQNKPESLINHKVNPLIKNHQQKSVVDLLDEIPCKNSQDYHLARSIITYLANFSVQLEEKLNSNHT